MVSRYILAIIFAALAAIVYRELQQVTLLIDKAIVINNKSPEQVLSVVSDPEAIVEVHPFAYAVSGVKSTTDETGNVVKYYIQHEAIPMYGLYDLKTTFSIKTTIYHRESSIVARSQLLNESRMGFSQEFELTGSSEGTTVFDRVNMTSYRFLIRFANTMGSQAHDVVLQGFKNKLEGTV